MDGDIPEPEARHAFVGEAGPTFAAVHESAHLKVVIVALIAGILVAGFGILMRNSSDEGPKPRA